MSADGSDLVSVEELCKPSSKNVGLPDLYHCAFSYKRQFVKGFATLGFGQSLHLIEAIPATSGGRANARDSPRRAPRTF
jgi:hypothetical protein